MDVGAGRCYFSEGMRRRGAEVLSVEGTASGFAACVVRAGANLVVRRDLRLPLDLPNGRRFALGNEPACLHSQILYIARFFT